MDVKLKIKDNSSYIGKFNVQGVWCQLWAYDSINEEINYYIRDDTYYPYKFEIISGASIYTINFTTFKSLVPDSSVFELNRNLDCEKLNRPGLETRQHVIQHLSAVPVLTTPVEPAKFLTKRSTSAIDPATLALIGKTIWAVVKENKPEANLETIQNAVIPQGTTWTDMAGWRQNKWPGWQWTLTNPYGATVVNYMWAFNHLCSGSYKNIGKYIENAAAFPTTLNVAWGYTVNVKAQILNPFNYGTSASPVAGLSLIMTMDSSTIIKKISQSCHVNLLGDCSTQLVSCSGYKSFVRFTYY
jgi:hypothetical protein